MKYAIINSGIVDNIALAEAPLAANWIETETAGVGWTYLDGVFTPPPTPEPTPEPALPKHISVGSFFDRFGAQKYPILASTDVMVRALIQDCSVRSYIDLDNAQLPYGLDMLIAAGYAIDKTAILTTPVSDSETPG